MANLTEARPAARVREAQSHVSRRKLTQSVLSHVALIALSIVFLTPFLWLLSTSLKPDRQIFAFPPVWIPNPPTLRNYQTGLNFIPFWIYLKNTLIYCGLSIVGTIISSSLVAYSLARIRWPGRNILFGILVATMIVPPQVTFIPLFLVFKNLGWLDSLAPLIVPHWFGVPFFIFLLRQFFMTIPPELGEAATIDGASEWQIFR
ncbi:MAG: carbohydrate ABC transporter permease, partial [Chloroflexia bacterium]